MEGRDPNQTEDPNIPQEPGFGQDVSDGEQTPPPREGSGYFKNLKEYVQERQNQQKPKGRSGGLNDIKPKPTAGAVKKAGGAALKQGAGTVAKAGAQTTAKAGVQALLGAGTGGVSLVVTAAGTVINKVGHMATTKDGRKTLLLIVLVLVAIIIAVGSFMLALLGNISQFGANPFGGSKTHPQEDPYQAAVLAQDRGQVVGTSLETMDAARAKIKALMAGNKLKLTGSQRAKANGLLQQMDALRAPTQTAAHASDKKLMPAQLAQYRSLMTELYAIIYPDLAQARARVKVLIDTGVITFTGVCQKSKSDLLTEGVVTPKLLHAVATIGEYGSSQGFTVAINCVKSGHGKNTKAGYVSTHTVGRGIDVHMTPSSEIAQKLLPFLEQKHVANPQDLDLRELIYNASVNGKSAGYYNISRSKLVRRPYAGDHVGHLHLSVSQSK